jgi:hypothetical protein
VNATVLLTAVDIDIPGYQIIRPIGEGGMASVFLAMQKSLDREVALKVMSPILAANADFASRFLVEGKITAKLQHPNLVTVYDIGTHKGVYYLAAEYIGGGTLKDKLAEGGLTVAEILDIISDVAHGLDFAHQKGFVHRDVKPALSGSPPLSVATGGSKVAVGCVATTPLFVGATASLPRPKMTQPPTASSSTPAPIPIGSASDLRSSGLDRLTRVRCCVAALPDRRGEPALRPADWCSAAPSGAVAISLWIASTTAAPVLKRSAGFFAIIPAISGCNHSCSSSSGTGCVTCISATVKGSPAWYGGRPASISNSIVPRLYRSERPSTGSPRACSGLM